MKKIILQLVFLTVLFASTAFSQSVYCVNSESLADVKVYLVDDEKSADLCVYFANNDNQAAGNSGKWCFVVNENEASMKIYFTDNINKADLKIYFVDSESKAGWKNKDKSYLVQ